MHICQNKQTSSVVICDGRCVVILLYYFLDFMEMYFAVKANVWGLEVLSCKLPYFGTSDIKNRVKLKHTLLDINKIITLEVASP